MQTIYLHLPRLRNPHVIDITPQPWWRRTGRAALALLTFMVAVPLLWLLSAALVTVLLAGVFAMLAYGAVTRGLPSRVGAGRGGVGDSDKHLTNGRLSR